MLITQSAAVANLGYDALGKKQYPQALDFFKQAVSVIELSPLDLSERPRLRAELINRENSPGARL